MAPLLPGTDPVDYGKLMGTVVTELQAIAAAQREVAQDFRAALGATQDFSSSNVISRRARTGLKALAGGADATAGQVSSGSASATRGPGMMRLVDPAAGRLSGPVPHTVEDARASAYSMQARRVFNAVAGFPQPSVPGSRFVHFLAGTTPSRTASGAGAAQGSGAGQQGAGGGGTGGSVPYVPGYGYYGGGGTPPTMGHGGGGQGGGRGGPHGGIPPSGAGSGGGSSHLGLVGTIGARIPVAGLAVRGIEEVLSQREKNAYYQNVEGGSNAGGFGERLSEEGYRWSTPGIFTSSEARQAFKGVTRIGFNGRVGPGHGPGRQQALNFVYHGKSSYGATVDESLTTLQTASENTETSLTNLSKTLKQLSDDAGAAGANAQMARSQMMGLFQQAISSGYGSGSTAAAGTISDTMASYGRSYANSDASGQLTPQYGRYAAAQAGMTYGQFTSLQKSNPQAAAKVRTGVGLQAINQVLTPQMQQFLRQQIVQYGGKVDESTSLQIASAFLGKFGRQIDPEVLNGQLSALTGIQFSDYDHALGWAAMQMSGNTEASHAGTALPSDLTGTGKVSVAQGMQWGLPIAGFSNNMLDKNVRKGIFSNGQMDPVMSLLASKVGNAKNEYVTVHTSSGPQVMALDQAMASHPNELAAGQVLFVGTRKTAKDPKTGKLTTGWAKDSYSGQTVSQVLGGQVDTSRQWQSEGTAPPTSGVPISQVPLAQQLASQTAANQASASQTVTVDLSADARKLLTVMGQTGTAGAAGEAAPPLNPFATNPSISR